MISDLLELKSYEGNQPQLSEKVDHIINKFNQKFMEAQSFDEASFLIEKFENILKNHRIRGDKSFNQAIDRIQLHIESTFHYFRNDQSRLSVEYLLSVQPYLNTKYELLDTALHKQKFEEDLIKILLRPLSQLRQQSIWPSLTSSHLKYAESYGDKLIRYLNVERQISKQELLRMIYLLDFNSVSMLSYIVADYQEQKKKIADPVSLLNLLDNLRQDLKLIAKPGSIRYNPELPSLKKLVSSWIKEEKEILNKELENNTSSEDDLKLQFDQSVDLITSLFRVLHDAGITKSGANHTIRWISKSISSKNMTNISQQSIQRKFYDKYANTNQLKEILEKMLDHIQSKSL